MNTIEERYFNKILDIIHSGKKIFYSGKPMNSGGKETFYIFLTDANKDQEKSVFLDGWADPEALNNKLSFFKSTKNGNPDIYYVKYKGANVPIPKETSALLWSIVENYRQNTQSEYSKNALLELLGENL
jgi:Tol biopolymer transport system component